MRAPIDPASDVPGGNNPAAKFADVTVLAIKVDLKPLRG
jgi:hypothetical protein